MDSIISNVYNEDCLAAMKRYPDKHFDLAIVDPPYGIGEDGKKNHSRGVNAKATQYTDKNWDKQPPSKEYFKELFRISTHVIIWGANHFIEQLPKMNSSCWLIWDKDNGDNDFADCEIAFTNFNCAIRKFKFKWQGMLQGDMKNKEVRIHPTQKPVKLYSWILKKFAEPHFKILDTHLGSGSSRIACYMEGIHFTGFEIDSEYFEKQEQRFNDFKSQLKIQF